MKDVLFTKALYFANACEERFLGVFPSWHKGLDKSPDCTIMNFGLNDIWVIVLNIIEVLLRIGGIAAVGFIIWGGIELVTSQGEPEKVGKARDTITNAVIGLVIVIFANVIISFVVGTIVGGP